MIALYACHLLWLLAAAERLAEGPTAARVAGLCSLRLLQIAILAGLTGKTGNDDALLNSLLVAGLLSFLAPPALVFLARRRGAPPLVRSRWLGLPFSAFLLPLLPENESGARHQKTIHNSAPPPAPLSSP